MPWVRLHALKDYWGMAAILRNQRRDQIKREVDRGKLAQDGHHSPIVLERVQADPGHDVAALGQVLVKRLVHVPQKHEVRLGHILVGQLLSSSVVNAYAWQ